MNTPGFGTRLKQTFGSTGALCVGIDPHAWLLEAWGLDDSAASAERLGRLVVESCAGNAGIVKPQIAYFERFGAAGFAALERVLADARSAGLLVIADVKRGDIGSTMDAYASAWLTAGSPLEADAITVSPYLGVGALHGAFTTAVSAGKGVFVLAATSNREASELQRATTGRGVSVARAIMEDVISFNRTAGADETEIASIGVVIGATLVLREFGIGEMTGAGRTIPVLAPGFGHQGASVRDVAGIYGSLAPGVIVSESRAILAEGPARLHATIAAHADEVRSHHG